MMRAIPWRTWAWLRRRSALALLVAALSGLAAGGVARLVGAVAVGELLAAAVTSVMLTSGRSLEAWAAERALKPT